MPFSLSSPVSWRVLLLQTILLFHQSDLATFVSSFAVCSTKARAPSLAPLQLVDIPVTYSWGYTKCFLQNEQIDTEFGKDGKEMKGVDDSGNIRKSRNFSDLLQSIADDWNELRQYPILSDSVTNVFLAAIKTCMAIMLVFFNMFNYACYFVIFFILGWLKIRSH